MPNSVDATIELGDAGDLAHAVDGAAVDLGAPRLGDHRGRKLLELQQQPQRRVERRAGLRALVQDRLSFGPDLEHGVLPALAVIGPQLHRQIVRGARSPRRSRARCSAGTPAGLRALRDREALALR
jgi:hypothetical protein